MPQKVPPLPEEFTLCPEKMSAKAFEQTLFNAADRLEHLFMASDNYQTVLTFLKHVNEEIAPVEDVTPRARNHIRWLHELRREFDETQAVFDEVRHTSVTREWLKSKIALLEEVNRANTATNRIRVCTFLDGFYLFVRKHAKDPPQKLILP